MQGKQVNNIVCYPETVSYPGQQFAVWRVADNPVDRRVPGKKVAPFPDFAPFAACRQIVVKRAFTPTGVKT